MKFALVCAISRPSLRFEADHVAIATGATWRKEYFDEERFVPVAEGAALSRVFTPDDIMDGKLPDGPTLVFDGDSYYMASVIAEKIRAQGHAVSLVTPSDSVSDWAGKTSERWRIRTHLLRLGVEVLPSKSLIKFDGEIAELECIYGGPIVTVPVTNIVMVTARKPNDSLYRGLLGRIGSEDLQFSLRRIGDCDAPAIIAAAVYAGHRYAQELEEVVDEDIPLKHDRVDVGQQPI